MASVTISIKAQPELREKIKLIAEQKSLSMSDIIKQAISIYIDQYEKEHGQLKGG